MSDRVEIERVTSRIRLVELAKNLASKGKPEEALQVLRQVRAKYDEEKMRQRVDWMIRDIERQRDGEPAPPSD